MANGYPSCVLDPATGDLGVNRRRRHLPKKKNDHLGPKRVDPKNFEF